MKFPLPELGDYKFTICVHPLPDAPKGIRKHHHFYDNGICHGCDKTHVRTCKVGDLPNLCKPCYDWMKKYSHMDDPYHITRMRAVTAIEDEIVKKAIRYAKVKTMDTAGLVGVSTGAILLNAYKAYKDALDEGASEEEARERRAYIELQDEMHRQAEMEEEATLQEHRQEILRKMRENQRIIDAQQARLNRLEGRNGINQSISNVKPKVKEVSEVIAETEDPEEIEVAEEKIKWKVLLKKYRFPIAIFVVLFLIFPQIRYPVLFVVVCTIWMCLVYYIEEIINR